MIIIIIVLVFFRLNHWSTKLDSHGRRHVRFCTTGGPLKFDASFLLRGPPQLFHYTNTLLKVTVYLQLVELKEQRRKP